MPHTLSLPAVICPRKCLMNQDQGQEQRGIAHCHLQMFVFFRPLFIITHVRQLIVTMRQRRYTLLKRAVYSLKNVSDSECVYVCVGYKNVLYTHDVSNHRGFRHKKREITHFSCMEYARQAYFFCAFVFAESYILVTLFLKE